MARFSDSLEVTVSDNSSDANKLLFGYDTYALQLQNTDTEKFKGQTFTVNLGSVEDALQSGERFQDSLKTSEMVMQVLDNSTAAVQLSDNFFNMISECSETDLSTSTSTRQRLSYVVFLTDILFQSFNQSRIDIGSIIVSTRLRCAANVTLINPIMLTFQTVEKVRWISKFSVKRSITSCSCS